MAGIDAFTAPVQRWLSDQGMLLALLPPSVQYFFAAVLGLVIGSFLTVVIHRLPIMMERVWQQEMAEALAEHTDETTEPPLRYDLSLPSSACPSCGHKLGLIENIPLLGYALAKGRCRGCGASIGMLYPLVEMASMLLALLAVWRFGIGLHALMGFALSATLLVLAVIDARTHLLPDSITLPLLWAGLLLNLDARFVPLADAVAGAAAGYGFLWLVYWIFRILRGKEGMGYGDFKLLAALGAWFGWQSLPQIVFVSALAGTAFGLCALLIGRRRADQALAFGPYLALAGMFTLFIGDPFMHWLARPLWS